MNSDVRSVEVCGGLRSRVCAYDHFGECSLTSILSSSTLLAESSSKLRYEVDTHWQYTAQGLVSVQQV